MKVSYRQDTSYLFNSMNGVQNTGASFGVSGLAGLVSDYNTIKNGSYNKLVKAYYKKMGDDAGTGTVSAGKKAAGTTDVLDSLLDKTKKNDGEKTKDSTSATSSKQYSQIASDASDLKSSLKALSADATTGNLYRERTVTKKDEEGNETSNWEVDRDAIYSAVSKFADSYNAILKSADGASNSSVSSRVSTLSKLAGSYSSQLKEIGISYDDKGALSVDKDKLAAADINKIRSVFNDVGSFGDRADSAATMIKSAATGAASQAATYNAGGTSAGSYNSVWNAQV